MVRFVKKAGVQIWPKFKLERKQLLRLTENDSLRADLLADTTAAGFQWWEQDSKCQDQDQDSEPTDQDMSK